MQALLVGLIDASRRHAVLVALLGLLLTGLAGWVTHDRLGVDTDANKLINNELPWRQRELAFDKLFPENVDLLAIVIDGKTPDAAEAGAEALAGELAKHKDLFRTVKRPDGIPFFAQNGLLFLSVDEVRGMADQLIEAQPLIGSLAADPSLRGLAATLEMVLQGVASGAAPPEAFEKPLVAIAETAESVLAGRNEGLSWQTLLTGRPPRGEELRRFVLVQPALDFDSLAPGAGASDMVRATAKQLGLTAEHGLRVRLTGPVALSDEEFASVARGAGIATALSGALVILILFLAVRSWRLILAILGTLVAGLAVTAGSAALMVGTLNLISIAFFVLFIGIAVDFGIQFSVRFREERFRSTDLADAMRGTARGIGLPLAMAAAATAVGFLSFVRTDYVGVRELGLIAGVGMVIAFLLNVTLLPALLTLVRPAGEPAEIGFRWAAPADRWMARHRMPIRIAALLLGIAAALVALQIRFDFNPLNLKDPSTESVSTLFELMDDPNTTPYTIDLLAPSTAAAADLAKKLEALPTVAQVVSLPGFVPEEQKEKLAILADAADLLGPTLSPPQVKPPPTLAETRTALAGLQKALAEIAGGPKTPASAGRLAKDLAEIGKRDDATVARFAEAVVGGLPRRLESLRTALGAQPVTEKDLPPELVREWIASNGQARLQVFPKGDARDNAVLVRFVADVRTIAPEATGAPVSIQESAKTIVEAFVTAGISAFVVIGILLGFVLRRLTDVLLVMAPLALASALTLATCVLTGMSIDFANIIALPLLLGIGVSFDIYFVMRWRGGLEGPLQSSTARAVLFSALTTTVAFGSLALSSHPGTAHMGKLLTLALGFTLLTTLFVLPALFPRRAA